MNERLLFISDFDGTVSAEDFYLQILRRCYPPEKEAEVENAFRDGSGTVFGLLSDVFRGMDRSEEELEAEIRAIPVDPTFPAFARGLRAAGADLVVLSAGCAYYIRRVLGALGLGWVTVYGNEGVYRGRGLQMAADPASPFYSPQCGIDKEKVVRSLRPGYGTLAYAGDGFPDLAPCLACDLRFAKGALAGHLERRGAAYRPFSTFAEIGDALRGLGLL